MNKLKNWSKVIENGLDGYMLEKTTVDRSAQWKNADLGVYGPEYQQPDCERRPYGDLRNAKWLDPECYAKGACQSLIFKQAQQPQPEPVAALLRSRHVSTWPNAAIDGKTHYSDWGDWLPTTHKHAMAVTDQSRNTDPMLHEMKPLYAAPQASLTPLGYEQIVAIWSKHMKTRALPNYEDFARDIEAAHGIGGK